MVKYGGVVKGQRKLIVMPDDGTEPREYGLPRGVHVNVHEGERVRAGEPLMDGPINPHDILRVQGEKELQRYLVNEIQEVYRLQGVNINDKHIEVIVAADDALGEGRGRGRHGLPPRRAGGQVPVPRGERAGDRRRRARRPRRSRCCSGITKASLSTDSFISAASFQETTRVLTEASISGTRRLPARPEGERDDGPADSRRHGLRVVSPRAGSRRTSRRRRRRPPQPTEDDLDWTAESNTRSTATIR